MPLLRNNMNKASNHSNHILECIILAMVVLASTSIGLESEVIIVEESEEIDYIIGTVTLSTRTAMNSLGLSEDTDIGAIATVNLSVNSILSEGCENCKQKPSGLQIEGFVEIQNIRNEMGGLGRIDGTLSITYLKEKLDENFISKEWFTINWNASGGTELDSFTQFTIIHNPPKLDLDNRYDASFITNDNNKESRTGPWLLAKTLVDGSLNIQDVIMLMNFILSGEDPSELCILTRSRSNSIVVPGADGHSSKRNCKVKKTNFWQSPQRYRARPPPSSRNNR